MSMYRRPAPSTCKNKLAAAYRTLLGPNKINNTLHLHEVTSTKTLSDEWADVKRQEQTLGRSVFLLVFIF